MATDAPATRHSDTEGHLRRDVGFRGLLFISLGSIIGSGWLLGALTAASAAGPASIISWVLGAAMIIVLALVHAELGAAYPAAGGTARYPRFAYGLLTGFAAGWAAWLQAVTIAPIEVEASLEYLANIDWISEHVTMLGKSGTLTASGLVIATVLMLLFTVINLVGVKFLSDSNSVTVIWKVAVPVVTIVVLLVLTFHGSNFTAGGGFAPFGAHGVFAALPLGVIFALQGFEQAIQMGGEARNPQRDLPRAVIAATLIGTVVYIFLEVAFIGGLDPTNLADGWKHPVAAGDFGPYATIATAAGASWLATVLYIDAFISPAGTGLIYLGTSSRLSYALGRERSAPGVLAKVNGRGVPVASVMLAFVIGEIAFLPFPSWSSLVTIVTSATAIMYAFAPVALIALRRSDGDRPRPYLLRAANVVAPLAFIAANLIIYWGGFETIWKLLIMMAIGLVVFVVSRVTTSQDLPAVDLRGASWVAPWLLGLAVIGYLGRYGKGHQNVLPDWVDLAVVAVFSLAIFAFAVAVSSERQAVHDAIDAEHEELESGPELSVNG